MNTNHKISRGKFSYEPPIVESVMITGEAGFQASGYGAEIDGMTENEEMW